MRVDTSLRHYPNSEPTSFYSFFLMLHASGKVTNANFIVSGLMRLGLEPTIYRSQLHHKCSIHINLVILI